MKNEFNLKEGLKKLNDIVEWFDREDELDLEVGLEKIKEGASLVKKSREKLAEIENEFNVIQKEIDQDLEIKDPQAAPEEEDVRVENIPF